MKAKYLEPAGRRFNVNGIDLFAETFGALGAPALLLVMGNSAPGLVWPDRFCHTLADTGLLVIRFDQRDTGLSTYADFSKAPYDLDQLADDAIGLLDAMGIGRAHIAGLSQGGELAFRVAARAPQRVLSLVAMMASADLQPKNDAFRKLPLRQGELSRPAPEYVEAVITLNSMKPESEAQKAWLFVENFRLAKGARSPFDESHWQEMGQAVASSPRRRGDGQNAEMANNSNHTLAQRRSLPVSAGQLAALRMPVLILHGSDDPIFPPDHARWTASAIPHARLKIIEGMGHALDPAFFEVVIQELVSLSAQVSNS